jgi:hypothetical protein
MIEKKVNTGRQYAKYMASGQVTGVDWRYELLHDYLRESPSYQLVCRFMLANMKGRPKNAPSDWPAVLKLYKDFGDVFRIKEDQWWITTGRDLYDIKIKDPSVLNLGITESSLDALPVEDHALVDWELMNRPRSLLIAVPTALTKKEAMTQLAAILKTQKFRTNVEPIAKYQLTKSKLQRNTLAVGPLALRSYKRGTPLWKIGYQLKLSPSDVSSIDKGEDVSAAKAYLQILASKLIHKAELIAENAARGRFPSDKSFPEAILISNQRKVGRPGKLKKDAR